LLFADAALAARNVTPLIPVLAAYDWIALTVIGLRAAVAVAECGAAMLLVWLASAVLLWFEIGAGLAPNSLPPGLRAPVVVAYWTLAAVASWALRFARRDAA
jgi:hypothetical protein